MSWKTQAVICPWGHAQSVQLPTRLQAYGVPDPRSSILDGTLGQATCITCQRRFLIEQQLTYIDHARGHWILMLPASTVRAWAGLEVTVPSLLEPVMKGIRGTPRQDALRVRLVFGYEQLREKLLLWEAGLDDRIMEVVKLQTLYRPELNLSTSSRFHLVLSQIDRPGARILFSARRLEPPYQPEPVLVGFQQYLEALDSLDLHRVNHPELFRAPFASALRYLLSQRSTAIRVLSDQL